MKNMHLAVIGLFIIIVSYVNVAVADDHGGTCHSATQINMNSTVSGVIETAGDLDVFRFSVSSQQTVTIFTTGVMDTFGALNTSNCQAIDGLPGNDNAGDDLNFKIVAQLPAGVYYAVVLAPPGKNITGKYTLHVQNTPEQVDAPDNNEACVSSTLLSNENMGYLQIIRNFRDNILSKNLTGLGLIRLYYKHSAEVINILNSDKNLKITAGGILLELVDIIKNTSSDDTIGSIAQNSIPIWLENDINAMLDKIADKGSDELKIAIESSRAELIE